MKQYLSLCVFTIALTTSFSMTAQVGIGTSNPQSMLHVAGMTSTIQIDGLNKNNNPNNDGFQNAPVSVDADGKLVLEKPITDRFVNNENFLSIPDFVATTIDNGSAYKAIYNQQVITANEAKVVFVGYNVSVLIREGDDSTKKINKTHQQKLYGVGVVVNETTTVTLPELQASYAVSVGYIAADNKYFDGPTYLSGHAMVLLDKNKTYYFHLVAFVRNSQDDSKGITTIYGGNGNLDRFQIFELN